MANVHRDLENAINAVAFFALENSRELRRALLANDQRYLADDLKNLLATWREASENVALDAEHEFMAASA